MHCATKYVLTVFDTTTAAQRVQNWQQLHSLIRAKHVFPSLLQTAPTMPVTSTRFCRHNIPVNLCGNRLTTCNKRYVWTGTFLPRRLQLKSVVCVSLHSPISEGLYHASLLTDAMELFWWHWSALQPPNNNLFSLLAAPREFTHLHVPFIQWKRAECHASCYTCCVLCFGHHKEWCSICCLTTVKFWALLWCFACIIVHDVFL